MKTTRQQTRDDAERVASILSPCSATLNPRGAGMFKEHDYTMHCARSAQHVGPHLSADPQDVSYIWRWETDAHDFPIGANYRRGSVGEYLTSDAPIDWV